MDCCVDRLLVMELMIVVVKTGKKITGGGSERLGVCGEDLYGVVVMGLMVVVVESWW